MLYKKYYAHQQARIIFASLSPLQHYHSVFSVFSIIDLCANNNMQHVLQTRLSAGMSAVSGGHVHKKPNSVPQDFDGLTSVIPKDWKPTGSTRITYKGKNGDVQASALCIGAWS